MEERSNQRPIGLVPTVAFGLATAALAGVMVAATAPAPAAQAAGQHSITTAFNELIKSPDTTCCPT